MHDKFAKRIALVAHQKRKAHSAEAVSLWWKQAFGHLPQQEFSQVMAELAKLRR
jgi:hypothetical protein